MLIKLTCAWITMAAEEGVALPCPIPHALLVLLMVAPLVLPVPTNVNIVLTALLTLYVGCWRSVKATPPQEAMTRKVVRLEFSCAPRSQIYRHRVLMATDSHGAPEFLTPAD